MRASPPPPGPGGFDTSVGNGGLGRWLNDELGLPAFRYQGGSGATPAAEVRHQIGNDSCAALSHADGAVELYTTRTFPRFANRLDPDGGHFAGGFGWVRDGDRVWSTHGEDAPPGSVREVLFGMGYLRRTLEHEGLRVRHTVYVPPGDDEVLMERIELENLSGRAKSVRYVDYWDVAWWLLRHPDPITSLSAWDPARVETRADARRGVLEVVSLAAPGDLEVPSLERDPDPKVSFLVSLDGPLDGFETLQERFLGDGGRALPAAVARGRLEGGVDASGALPSEAAVLVAERALELGPGESRALHFAYGIASRGEAERLIGAYLSGPPDRLMETASSWARRLVRFELPGESWLDRELAWNEYALLSARLREDFFGVRTLNQGSIYQYQWGANAGPRATLRHLLPLVYSEPEAAREALVYELRAMAPTGELAYATAGYGAWNRMGFLPSDGGLWLLWSAAEYLGATRDFALLDESFAFHCPERRGACGSATGYEMLKRAYRYQEDVVGRGPHGLVRLLRSDWDDLLRGSDAAATFELGESTMNTALALVAYPRLAEIAERRGEAAFAAEVRRAAGELGRAMRAQWRGEFFNRAYVYASRDEAVEVGDQNLFLGSNGIALVADGLVDGEQAERLVRRIRTDALDPSPAGLAAAGAPLPGIGTGGFWYSLSGPAIEGLLRHRDAPGAREVAWEAFLRQTLARHADAYPGIWYGVWSGPDMYFTPIEAPLVGERPGETWCLPGVLCMRDLPVTNLFSHSETLLAAVRMAGVRPDLRGLVIDPAVPAARFRWSTPAFEVAYEPGAARGAVRPLGDDRIEMRVRLPSGLAGDEAAVRVDGREAAFRIERGRALFSMEVRAGRRSSWAVGGRASASTARRR